MRLSQKQQIFTHNVARLISYLDTLSGYGVTFAEAYRTPEQAALNAKKGSGIKESLHTQRLAIDLNLFINGEYQSTTKAHKPLGEFWESLNSKNRWGGRFKRKDGNHYEMQP